MTNYGDPLFHRHVAGRFFLFFSLYFLAHVHKACMLVNSEAYKFTDSYLLCLYVCAVSVAGVWGLLALHLADEAILPFYYLSYADQLKVPCSMEIR